MAALSSRGRLLITLAAPLVGVLLVEGGLSAFDIRRPPGQRVEGSLFKNSADPVLIFENNPGAVKTLNYRTSQDDPGRLIQLRVNEQGFRGPLVPLERTAGRKRIACIGDSHTFGEGVGDDETWPAHLERILAERDAESSTEVLNAGVDAYDTLQEVLWMEQRVLAYRPDVVILQYYMNDTAARGLDVPAATDLLLELASPHRQGWVKNVRSTSRLADLVLDGIYRRRSLTLFSDLRREQYEPDHPGWLRVQSALRRARDGLVERGTRFGVALYPYLVRRGGEFTSHEAFAVVAAFCKQEGIACLDTSSAFDGLDAQSLRVAPSDYHANTQANAVFAAAVADWIVERGWLD